MANAGDAMVVIRHERVGDREAVQTLITAAFGVAASRDHHDGPVPEAVLNDRLRASPAWRGDLSFVAELDGTVVGQVTCSNGTVQSDSEPARQVTVPAIGPVAVRPELQRRGLGSSLVREVIARATDAAEVMLVLLGSPEFYGRFGFVPASTYGVEPPDLRWGEHFQVKVLRTDRPVPSGRFTYARPFDLV